MQRRVNGFHVVRPLMFGRVRPKAGHSYVDQTIEEFRLLFSDPIFALIQVPKTTEPTVAELDFVIIVVNIQVLSGTRLVAVEVERRKRNAIVFECITVVITASSSLTYQIIL